MALWLMISDGNDHKYYPVTLNSGIYCVCKHKHKLDLSARSFAGNKCGFESCRGLSAAQSAAAQSLAITGENDLIAVEESLG